MLDDTNNEPRHEKLRPRRSVKGKVSKITTQISGDQVLARRGWRQIKRAFREYELPDEEAEKLVRARNEGRERGEVVGYLDLGRARFAALRRGIESGAVSAVVIGYD